MTQKNSVKPTSTNDPIDEVKVDKLLEKLSGVVEKLEDDDTPIEEAFLLFEEGTKISQQLNDKIMSYEKKLKILMGNELVDTDSDKYI